MIRRTKCRMALCITLLCLNLVFIWGNSLLPGDASSALSQWAKDIILRILGFPLSGPGDGSGLLRKLAHFSEFTLLGVVLSWLLAMALNQKPQQIILTVSLGCAVACLDETIQRFVPGRYCSLVDVGIDSSGIVTGIILFFAGYLIFQRKQHLED